MRDRTPPPISGKNRISERCLMQPRLDLTKRIPPLGCVRWCGLSRGSYDRCERKLNPQMLRMPPHDECRDDGLITTGRGAEEIDDRDLMLHRIEKPAVIRRVRAR